MYMMMEKDKYHDFTHMWKVNKHIDAQNRLVVTKGEEGGGRPKGVKGHIYMVTDGNQTFGGGHDVTYTEAEI